MCNCYSYNWCIGTVKETILKAPNWSTRDTICIDACIVKTIKHLWANNIVTHGSCCGHNKVKPNVIIEDESTKEYAEKVKALIKEVDDREWSILSWCTLNSKFCITEI